MKFGAPANEALGRLDAWSSLARARDAAVGLGGEAGEAWVEDWLQSRLKRVGDLVSARRFSAAMALKGHEPEAFADRIVEENGLRLLGGIRFYGGDPNRPFVDALAWSGGAKALREPGDWRRIARLIGQEWAHFSPQAVRILTSIAQTPRDATRDLDVHAAPYAAIRRKAKARAVAVRLEPLEDVALAADMARERYDDLRKAAPELAARMAPAVEAELSRCAAVGGLFAIKLAGDADREPAGLLAVEPGAVDWLKGDVIVEEVVLSRFAGRGLAAEAQRALAEQRADQPERLLIGTIDDLNAASRKTAERAGRPAMLRYAFLPINAGE